MLCVQYMPGKVYERRLDYGYKIVTGLQGIAHKPIVDALFSLFHHHHHHHRDF